MASRPPASPSTPSKPRATSGSSVTLSRRVLDSIRRGHPWVYRAGVIAAHGVEGAPGAIVRIADESHAPIGWGVWDPVSPIAVRVWSLDPVDPLSPRLFLRRLEQALAIRRRLFADGQTTAYRLLHGEGDRTPGYVLDRYGDVAVLRIDGEAAAFLVDELLAEVEPLLRAAGISTLLHREGKRGQPPQIVARFGSLRDRIEVCEHGVPFVVDLARGQKTGAFLDQRENRRRVGELVARRKRAVTAPVRVLNLFSYAGGFSLRAARAGGAVTSVDIAMAAHATAQESFRLAGVSPGAHAFVTADAFAFLESAKRRGERWEVVISDPPSFAPSEKAKAKGLAAYRALHRACAEVLAPSGTLIAASCSSHISAEDFASTLDDAALGRADLRLLEQYGPPADHPTLPAFPEGRYLKLAVLE
jgi:23S rRNA (cytosine1962-C5)-methyltransferase